MPCPQFIKPLRAHLGKGKREEMKEEVSCYECITVLSEKIKPDAPGNYKTKCLMKLIIVLLKSIFPLGAIMDLIHAIHTSVFPFSNSLASDSKNIGSSRYATLTLGASQL